MRGSTSDQIGEAQPSGVLVADGNIPVITFFLDALVSFEIYLVEIVDAMDRLGERIPGLFLISLIENGH